MSNTPHNNITQEPENWIIEIFSFQPGLAGALPKPRQRNTIRVVGIMPEGLNPMRILENIKADLDNEDFDYITIEIEPPGRNTRITIVSNTGTRVVKLENIGILTNSYKEQVEAVLQ